MNSPAPIRALRPVLLLALLCGLVPLLSWQPPSASAAEMRELEATWTDPPDSIGNGGLLTGRVRLNLNDELGEGGSADNVTIEVVLTRAVHLELPEACLTESVDPSSAIIDDGRRLRCNFGTLQYGTAAVLDYGVRAVGGNGERLGGTVTTESASVDLPEIPITAQAGIDVVFDASQTTTGEGPLQFVTPWALTLPVGSELLSGPISLDLTVHNDTTDNARARVLLESTECDRMRWSGGNQPATMPPTRPTAPVPTTCTISRTGEGTFRVTMDGYRMDLYGAPGRAVDGSALPPDRVFFATGSFRFKTNAAITPNPSSFRIQVTNVSATTVTGSPAPEVDTTNNTESFTVVSTGQVSSNWDRMAGSGMTSDIDGQGAAWDASPVVAPGQLLEANVANGIWGDTPVASVPTGTQWSSCIVLDGDVAFTGTVLATAFQPHPVTRNIRDFYPSSSVRWEWSTTPVGASGTRDEVDCGDLTFTRATTTDEEEVNGQVPQRITNLPAGPIRAIRLTVLAANTRDGITRTPTQVRMYVGARVHYSATPGTQVWELGSVLSRSGAWYRSASHGPALKSTPGSQYPNTNSMRDVANVIAGRPWVTKSADVAQAALGERVRFTLESGVAINTGSTETARWQLVDELPAGFALVPGSASVPPDSIESRADGGTWLRWNLSGEHNSVQSLHFDAVVEFRAGVRTNLARVDGAAFGPFVPDPANGGLDTVDVAAANAGKTILTKAALTELFAAGSANTWRLSLTNSDAVAQEVTDIIDVLPWNGDARGSAFRGGYTITGISLNPGESAWITNDPPAALERDPASAGGLGTPDPQVWRPWSDTPAPGVTAVRIVGGELPVGAVKHNEITWDSRRNRPGDTYENVAWAKASNTGLQMIRAAATAAVGDGSSLQIDKAFKSATGWEDGAVVTFDVAVRNSSDATAHEVVVTDLGGVGLDPDSVRFTNLSAGAEETGRWEVGDLAAGEVVTGQVELTLDLAEAPEVLENRIIVENPSNPYDLANLPDCQATGPDALTGVKQDTDQCDVEFVEMPRIRIDKKTLSGPDPNGWTTWDLAVRNDARFDLTRVLVTEHWPEGMDLDSVVVVEGPSQGQFEADRWEVGTLTPGQTATMTIRAQVSQIVPEARNTAIVTTPDLPDRPEADCVANDDLDSDTDQCDWVPVQTEPPTPRLAPPGTTPTGFPGLPDTGGPTPWLIIGGIAGVVLGGVLAAGSRRRRRRAWV